jgi:hypothetical protein
MDEAPGAAPGLRQFVGAKRNLRDMGKVIQARRTPALATARGLQFSRIPYTAQIRYPESPQSCH